jgi:hypothetical protein
MILLLIKIVKLKTKEIVGIPKTAKNRVKRKSMTIQYLTGEVREKVLISI